VPRASAHAMRKRSEVMLNQLWWHETPGIQSLPIVPWKADKPSCVAPSICRTSQKQDALSYAPGAPPACRADAPGCDRPASPPASAGCASVRTRTGAWRLRGLAVAVAARCSRELAIGSTRWRA